MADRAFTERLTKRLRLTRMQQRHVLSFAAYRADPVVAQYQSWDSYSQTEAASFIEKIQKQDPDVQGEWFQFAIEERSSDLHIGDLAMGVSASDPRLVEIGFTIAPDHQRKGYAFEAASSLLSYLLEERSKHRITATTDVLNSGSIALLESLGFKREAHFRENIYFKGRWGDEFVYALRKSQWTNLTVRDLTFQGDRKKLQT